MYNSMETNHIGNDLNSDPIDGGMNNFQKKRKSCEIAKIVEQMLDDSDDRPGRKNATQRNTFADFGTIVANNLNFLPVDRAYVLQFKINELISNEMNRFIAKQTGIEDLLLSTKPVESDVPLPATICNHKSDISPEELNDLRTKVNRNVFEIDTLKEQMNTLVEALSNQNHEVNLEGMQAQFEHTVINGRIVPQSIVESAILSHPNSNELGFKYLCDSVVGKEYWNGMTMGKMSSDDRLMVHGLIDLYVRAVVTKRMGTTDLSNSESQLLLDTLKTKIFSSFKKRLTNLRTRYKEKIKQSTSSTENSN